MTDDVDADSSSEPTTTRSRPELPDGDVVLEGEADAESIIEEIEAARHPKSDEIDDDEASWLTHQQSSRPPQLRLPGFGEAEEDCGEFVLPAMRFCVRSGKTHEFKHNCLRYDCPQHAPYAVRRRAAGTKDASGVAPQLKSLILRLYHQRNEMNHHYHHLFFSPPDDFYLESDEPLKRCKEVIRDVLDELGAQGLVGYHPYRGDDEDRMGDDRGFWKDLLFHRSNWDEAREDLTFSPHFHVLAVAPHIDVSVTEKIERRTGWVIHRRTDENGRSIAADPSKGDDSDDDAMCRVLTYLLSHCGIYETEEGQRRLAAWMKGPDVASTEVYPKVKASMSEKVHLAAEDTLGIASPSLECDCDFHQAVDREDPAIGDVESGAVDRDSWPWPDGPTGEGDLPRQHQDLPRENRTELPLESVGLGSSSSSSISTSDDVQETEDIVDDDDRDDQEPTCGAYLKHISKAGEYLLEAGWRETAPYADDLEGAYQSYIDYMTSRDLDPLEDVPSVPELTDPPPSD